MSGRGFSSDRRRGHPSGGPGLNQLARSGITPGTQLGHLHDTPWTGGYKTSLAGSALTERSNSMDENGTNSSSSASPIWLICVVPTVAAQAQRGPYITYSVIVP